VEIIAAILLPVAILMCVYSLTVFIWRSKAISKKQVSPAMHHYSCQDCHHHHCVTVITVLPVVTVTDTRSALQCMHHMSGFEFQLDKKFGQRGCKDVQSDLASCHLRMHCPITALHLSACRQHLSPVDLHLVEVQLCTLLLVESERRPLHSMHACLNCSHCCSARLSIEHAQIAEVCRVLYTCFNKFLQVGYIDDPRGPLGLAGVVVLALTAILILEVLDFVAALKAHHK